MILYQKNDFIYYEDGSIKFWVPAEYLQVIDIGIGEVRIWIYQHQTREHKTFVDETYLITDVHDKDDSPYGTTVEDIMDGLTDGQDVNIVNDSIDVALQDQTTDPIIQKFNNVHDSTTLNGAISIDDTTIVVTSSTGIVVGSHLILFDPASIRFSTFIAINVVGTTITLDRPIDFDYPDGTFVDVSTTDMAVDGSVTPVTFGLRGTGTPPGIELTLDITRIIITLLCSGAPAYDLFGDLTALTKGIQMRKRDGKYFNIFNAKTNGEWAGFMYDMNPADAINPSQGQNGWIGRMTFAGQNKMGVAIRLPIGEDVEFIIQDDLSDLDLLEIVAEGHIVDP